MCGLLLCILTTIYLYYAAGILQLDGIVNTVIQEGDKVFHWGNTTFNTIVEKVGMVIVMMVNDNDDNGDDGDGNGDDGDNNG